MSNKNQTTKTNPAPVAVETKPEAAAPAATENEGMTVTTLVSPDRLKALQEEQRKVRIEMKNIKEALKKQKASEEESLPPLQRIEKKVARAARGVVKQIDKLIETDAAAPGQVPDFAALLKLAAEFRKLVETEVKNFQIPTEE